MGWVALLQGEVRFAAGGVERWRGLDGELRPAELPDMLASAIGAEAEQHSVEDALLACDDYQDVLGDGAFFLDVAVEGEHLTVEAMLVEDDYREVGRHVLALVVAAAQAGGTGRLQVRDVDAYEGGAIDVRGGRASFEIFSTDGLAMSEVDRAGYDAVRARSTRRAEETRQTLPMRPVAEVPKKTAKKATKKAGKKPTKKVAKKPARKPGKKETLKGTKKATAKGTKKATAKGPKKEIKKAPAKKGRRR
jgi:hypothetical protein